MQSDEDNMENISTLTAAGRKQEDETIFSLSKEDSISLTKKYLRKYILKQNKIRRSHSRSSNQRSDNQLQTSFSQMNTTTIDQKNDLSFCDDSNKENNSLQINQSFTNGCGGYNANNLSNKYSKMKKFHIANSFINKSSIQEDTLSNNSRLLLEETSPSISNYNQKTLNKSFDQGLGLNNSFNQKRAFLFDFKQSRDQHQTLASIANQTRETNDMVLYEEQSSYRFKETFRNSMTNAQKSDKISSNLIQSLQKYDKHWNQLRAKAIDIIEASSYYKIKYMNDLSTEFRNIDKSRISNLSEIYNLIDNYDDLTQKQLVKSTKTIQSDISEYERQIQILQKQVQDQKRMLDKIEQENEILAGLKRIQEQSTTSTTIKSAFELEVQEKQSKLNSQISFLKQENASLKENMVKQDKERQQLKEESLHLKKECKKYEIIIQKQTQEMNSLENSLHEAKKEQKSSLKYDLEILKRQLQEKDIVLDEQVKKLNETMSLKENIRQKQKLSWEESYKQLKEEIRKLKVDNSSLKLENEKATRSVFENKNERKQLEQYQKQNEFLSQKIKEHKAHSDKLMDAIGQIKQIAVAKGFNDFINPFIRLLEL